MNLAIDFGISYTKIGYIKDNIFINLTSINGIPSAFAYIPTQNKLFFGHNDNAFKLNDLDNTYIFLNLKLKLKRNLDFKIGDYNLADILYNYFLFLDENYVKPTQLSFKSVSISMPNYIGLKARQLLIKILNKIYPQAIIYLAPESVAALAGYTIVNKHSKLDGDILLINLDGKTTNFSFLTFSSDLKEIIIESQLQLEQDIFSSSVIEHIINKAKKLGLHDYTGWKLDNILLLGEVSQIVKVYDFLVNQFAPIPIIKVEDKSLSILKGLAIWPNIINSPINIKTIYPFNFYIQSLVNNTLTLEPLKFDTSTLDLDISSQYTICRLPLNSPYNLSNSPDKAIFKIFEIKEENEVSIDVYREQEIILNIEIPNNIQDQNIDIILDFKTARLMANYNLPAREVREFNLETNDDWLLFADQNINLKLTQDVNNFLSEVNLSSPLSLDEQLKLLKYKLLTLLIHIN